MYGRVLCYFCEALIDADEEGFCPYCHGSMERTLDREWCRNNLNDWQYKEPKTTYFVDGGVDYATFYVSGGHPPNFGKRLK